MADADEIRHIHRSGEAAVKARRIALAVVLAIVLIAPLEILAQQPRLPRIGVLATANPRSSSFFLAFEQRLRDLGYVEDQNIAFEYRSAEGKGATDVQQVVFLFRIGLAWTATLS